MPADDDHVPWHVRFDIAVRIPAAVDRFRKSHSGWKHPGSVRPDCETALPDKPWEEIRLTKVLFRR